MLAADTSARQYGGAVGWYAVGAHLVSGPCEDAAADPLVAVTCCRLDTRCSGKSTPLLRSINKQRLLSCRGVCYRQSLCTQCACGHLDCPVRCWLAWAPLFAVTVWWCGT